MIEDAKPGRLVRVTPPGMAVIGPGRTARNAD